MLRIHHTHLIDAKKALEGQKVRFSIIADEATDVANREQFIRWVNAETLCTVITDILTRCSLPLSMCRG